MSTVFFNLKSFRKNHGYSDRESRVSRNGKTYDLGYKAHVSVNTGSDMPLAVVVASAYENEKKHARACSQYSSKKVRDCISGFGAQAVVPYMSNQAKGEPVLRVDRFFKTSGSAEERRLYGLGRACVERVNARLELVSSGGESRGKLKKDPIGNILSIIEFACAHRV